LESSVQIGDISYRILANVEDNVYKIESFNDGSFIVAYSKIDQTDLTKDSSIYVQKFSSNNTKVGTEIKLEGIGTDTQDFFPIVKTFADGSYTVIYTGWNGISTDIGNAQEYSLFVEKFDANSINTSKVQLGTNVYTSVNNSVPYQVAEVFVDGTFIVGYTDNDNVYLQKFAHDGSSIGSAVLLQNPNGVVDYNMFPNIAKFNDGSFIVSFESGSMMGTSTYIQKYDANGVAVGDQIKIDTNNPNGQDGNPKIVTFADGTYVLSYTSYDGNTDEAYVYVQKFNSDGSKVALTVKSNELGTAYLVKNDVMVNSIEDILSLSDNVWNSTTITAINTDTPITTKGLIDGTYKLYTADRAGNLSAGTTYTLDTVAPTVTNVQITSATGVQNNYLNAGDMITVTVTMDEDVIVAGVPSIALMIGTTEVRATYDTVNSTSKSLKFNYTILSGQSDTNGISVKANSLGDGSFIRDTVGNDAIRIHNGVVDNANYKVDAIAPATPAIDPVTTDDKINATEKAAGFNITGIAEKGSTVEVTLGTKTVTVTADASTGIYSASFVSADVPADTTSSTVTVVSKDSAGNSSISTKTIEIDTVIPNAPTMDDIAGNNVINQSKASSTITGTAESNATVYLVIGGNTRQVTVDTNGNWSYSLMPSDITSMGEGTKTITATVKDSAKNESTSISKTITVDTTPPVTPIVSEITDDTAPQTGVIINEGSTNDTTPTIKITFGTDVKIGDTIQLYNGTTALGSAYTINATDVTNRYVNITTATLADATYNINAKITDGVLNTSVASADYIITVDTIATNAPTVSYIVDDVDPIQGTVLDGGSTNDTDLTVRVSLASTNAIAGDKIQLFDGTTVLVTRTITASDILAGYVDIDTPTLTDGTKYNINSKITDIAGNVSNASANYSVTIDTVAPTIPTITSVTDDVTPTVGNILSGGYTNDTTPTVRVAIGSDIKAGDSVQLFNGTLPLGTAYVVTAQDVTNTYVDITTPALTHGQTYSLNAKITDIAGNVGNASSNHIIKVDTLAPTFTSGATATIAENTVITTVVYDATANDGGGDDTNIIYTLSGVDATLFNINSTTGEVTFKVSPDYEIPTDNGASNIYDISVIATDRAGNQTTKVVAVTVSNSILDDTPFVPTTNPTIALTGVASGFTLNPYVIDATAGNANISTRSNMVLLSDGSYGVAWVEQPTTGYSYVYYKKLDANGNTLVSETKLGTIVNNGDRVDMVALAGGGFAIAYSYNPSPSYVNLETINASGVVTTRTLNPSIIDNSEVFMTALPNGGYVVTWTSQKTSSGGSQDVVYQVFDSTGATVGSLGRLDSYTNVDMSPTVASFSNSDFVIAWSGADSTTTSFDIYVQRFNSSGVAITSKQTLDGAGGSDYSPQVVVLKDGGYAVYWRESSGKNYIVTYNASNTFLSKNEVGAGQSKMSIDNTSDTMITPLKDGGYVVTWDKYPPAYSYTQQYDKNGVAVGGMNMITVDGVTTIRVKSTEALSDGGYLTLYTTGNNKFVTQRFDANGNKVGTLQSYDIGTVNPYGYGNIVNTPDGGYKIMISSDPVSTGTVTDIMGFDKSGAPTDGTSSTLGNIAIKANLSLGTYTGATQYKVTYNEGTLKIGGVTYSSGSTVSVATWNSANSAGTIVLEGVNNLSYDLKVTATVANGSGQIVEVSDVLSGKTDTTVTGTMAINVSGQIISGTATANALVEFYVGSTLIGSGYSKTDGTYQVNNITLLSPNNTVTMKIVGKTVATATYVSPTIVSVTDDLAPTTGTLTSGASTNDNTPTIKVGLTNSGAVAGDIIKLYNGVSVVGTYTLQSTDITNGYANVTPTLSDATYAMTVKITDSYSLSSAATSAFNLTIDSTPPSTPVIGMIATDDIINASEATSAITGTSEANATINLTIGANTRTVTANASGVWSYTLTSTDIISMGEGSGKTITATATDSAGNVSDVASRNVTVDTLAPNVSTITEIIDDVAPITGMIVNNGSTNDSTPTVQVNLTGTNALTGDTIQLYNGAIAFGSSYSITASDITNGYANITTATLADGTYNINAKVIDSALNASNSSANYVITVDTIVPTVPTVNTLSMNATSSTISGTATLGAGESLSVTINGATYNNVAVSAGTWSINTVSTTPSSGTLGSFTVGNSYDVVAKVVDSAENSSVDSSTNEITVVNSAPTFNSTIASLSTGIFSTISSSYGTFLAAPVSNATLGQSGSSSTLWTGSTSWKNGAGGNGGSIMYGQIVSTDPTSSVYGASGSNISQSGFSGPSPMGGTVFALSGDNYGNKGLATNSLSNLIIGQKYTVGIVWEGIQVNSLGGGNITIWVQGGSAYTTYSQAQSYSNDVWSVAAYTFVAVSTTASFQVNGPTSAGIVAFDAIHDTTYLSNALSVKGAGAKASTIFGATTDANSSDTLKGYAITSASLNGDNHWQYSHDNGITWVNLDSASVTTAILIGINDLVRWSGTIDTNTTLSAVAVDSTSSATIGSIINVSTRGGSTPYSANMSTLAANSTPIMLDLDGNGVHTISASSSNVVFDVNADGKSEHTAWSDGKDGFLVLDLNQNGLIENGSELFGNGTTLKDGTKAKDGYDALKQYDENHDNVIDVNDSIFAKLQIWVDKNKDGISTNDELQTLQNLDIKSLNLITDDSSKADNGNLLGLISSYTKTDGTKAEMADVWFATGEAPASPILQTPVVVYNAPMVTEEEKHTTPTF
jgi:large repetitive protein